jgi:hypothetical protein
MTATRQSKRLWLRPTARAVGSIWVALWVLFEIAAWGFQGGGLLALVSWIFLPTLFLAWRREALGGALLVLETLALLSLFRFPGDPGIWVFTLPLLLVGSLFLASGWTARTKLA